MKLFDILRLEGSVKAAQEEYERIQKQVCFIYFML